ncbi:MAG: alpha/beta fold hydrolase [Anaerolineae bacterium]
MDKILASFTKKQQFILIMLAVVTCLVITLLGSIMISQTRRRAAVPSAPVATATPALITSTLTVPPPVSSPTLPPTWTPTPEITVLIETPSFEQTHCPFDVPIGAQVDCGVVIVREDREGTDPNDVIRLAVAVYHSTSDNPQPDPVIFLQGGPGSGAVEDIVLAYDSFIAPILAERDLIVFDQRGTGLSQPLLDCPEYSRLVERQLRQGFFIGDEDTAQYTDALLACRDRLTRRGADLAAYTSAASAADVNDIVTVLGYEQVNLYGASYGTRLAQTVMRDFPGIVRSAVLDSALPLEIDIYNEQAAKTDYALNKLFAGCAANPGCNAAYPNLERMYYDLVAQLDAEPVSVWGVMASDGRTFNVDVNGVELTSAVFFAMYATDLIPMAPQMINDVRLGDYTWLRIFLAAPMNLSDGLSLGMMLSVNCHEEIFATTPEEIDAANDAYPNTAVFGKSALFGSAEEHYALCETWGAAPFDPREIEPVTSPIPALILVGEYDPATPPSFGLQVAENLPNSYFFEFPGRGHTSSVGVRACPFEMALAFLTDPTTTPDSTCIADMTEPDFFVD